MYEYYAEPGARSRPPPRPLRVDSHIFGIWSSPFGSTAAVACLGV
jgi:hypothetical protein